ncbi:MAG TPA: D-alanyl-D-alanine carboxypeptidase/D-alanyl-D-alanine-endopeptidase [Chitinophagaceae bacterium]|jgi:D-alanyl-D-alanine carboxypeptidase/D-alanyl-D-alanine-endopeptidase (penicillin-binding protein 4)|nr:D-alanyl-D-alanine carboxypeptidase/D-alanyl-D-alanine-endopeptidase [Chitinophagaceae bacterium]
MKKAFLVAGCWLLVAGLHAQTVKEKLQKAYQQFESDTQLRHASSSLYVINVKTGEVVFDKNSQVGLAPASTQKIITAATAFELLGKDFRYETKFGHVGKIKGNVLFGNFYIKSVGDPTFGSWRWVSTSDSTIGEKIKTVIRKLSIISYGGISVDHSGWNDETIPDGWIWQDIGNYYGAGTGGFNWRENQYDIILRSGSKVGDPVRIVRKRPEISTTILTSLATSAAKGTGDNAYVYYPLHDFRGVIRGTIPVDENAFTISSASPNPSQEFKSFLIWEILSKMKIGQIHYEGPVNDTTILFSHYSPHLDSIIYWFLKKSINLYGEALIKTIAYEKKGFGATDTAVLIVKDFWKQKGLDPEELNIKDGSGLSPQNRVTTHAQVEVLKFAKKQSWFSYFFDALPEYNNMKMKSGTISDVKGFCGYHTSGDGTQYIFSFLVNNYSGSSSSVVQKMYKVLDVLK